MATAERCEEHGGHYQGDDSTCRDTECDGGDERGACCLPNGHCVVVSPALLTDVCFCQYDSPVTSNPHLVPR